MKAWSLEWQAEVLEMGRITAEVPEKRGSLRRKQEALWRRPESGRREWHNLG